MTVNCVNPHEVQESALRPTNGKRHVDGVVTDNDSCVGP